MVKFFCSFSFVLFLLGCNTQSKNSVPTECKSVWCKLHGEWVVTDYIGKLRATKSPFVAIQGLGITCFFIDTEGHIADTSGLTLGIVKGQSADKCLMCFPFSTLVSISRDSNRFVFDSLHFTDPERSGQLFINPEGKDTTLVMICYDSKGEIFSSCRFTRVSTKKHHFNRCASGIEYITQKIIFSDIHHVIDIHGNKSNVYYTPKGQIGFWGYEIETIPCYYNSGVIRKEDVLAPIEHSKDVMFANRNDSLITAFDYYWRNDTVFLSESIHEGNGSFKAGHRLTYYLVK